MRDFRKLKAFELADKLALSIYKKTASFPRHEQFGMTSQIRRAAVSIPSNIVEGCSRRTESDFLHFLDIAYASARELEYQISLAYRLEYMPQNDFDEIFSLAEETGKVLHGLINSLRK